MSTCAGPSTIIIPGSTTGSRPSIVFDVARRTNSLQTGSQSDSGHFRVTISVSNSERYGAIERDDISAPLFPSRYRYEEVLLLMMTPEPLGKRSANI